MWEEEFIADGPAIALLTQCCRAVLPDEQESCEGCEGTATLPQATAR